MGSATPSSSLQPCALQAPLPVQHWVLAKIVNLLANFSLFNAFKLAFNSFDQTRGTATRKAQDNFRAASLIANLAAIASGVLKLQLTAGRFLRSRQAANPVSADVTNFARRSETPEQGTQTDCAKTES